MADAGYFSEANVNARVEHAMTPLIAVSRQAHHPDPLERFTEPPPPLEKDTTEMEKMRHLLRTMAGRAL